MRLLGIIDRYRYSYKNYLKVMYKVRKEMMTGKENEIKVKLKNGTVKKMLLDEVLKYASENYYMNYLKVMSVIDNVTTINYNNQLLRFQGGDQNGDLIGVFFTEDYKFLDPKGSVVIDIGANIGDSAIYFALNGAEKIIALEPYPYSYNLAQENIKINNFNDKVELLNAGYGKDSSIIVNQEEISGVGSNLISAEKGKSIPIISLKTLVNRYNIKDGVLKMDCEGCEYNLINEDEEVLKRFSRIQIEYHYGLQTLVNKLESCGFSVENSKPTKRNSDALERNMNMGFIYAKKL